MRLATPSHKTCTATKPYGNGTHGLSLTVGYGKKNGRKFLNLLNILNRQQDAGTPNILPLHSKTKKPNKCTIFMCPYLGTHYKYGISTDTLVVNVTTILK